MHFSIRVYVWASGKEWAHFWGKPCLCEFVCSGSYIFEEKSNFRTPRSLFYPPVLSVNFSLLLLPLFLIISISLWKLPFPHPSLSSFPCICGVCSSLYLPTLSPFHHYNYTSPFSHSPFRSLFFPELPDTSLLLFLTGLKLTCLCVFYEGQCHCCLSRRLIYRHIRHC